MTSSMTYRLEGRESLDKVGLELLAGAGGGQRDGRRAAIGRDGGRAGAAGDADGDLRVAFVAGAAHENVLDAVYKRVS